MKGYSELKQEEISLLSENPKDIFHFIKSFGENEKQKAGVWILEDPIQKLETATCGFFQVFFYNNLFLQYENSKIQSHKELTKEAAETLFKKLLHWTNNKTKTL